MSKSPYSFDNDPMRDLPTKNVKAKYIQCGDYIRTYFGVARVARIAPYKPPTEVLEACFPNGGVIFYWADFGGMSADLENDYLQRIVIDKEGNA